MVSIHYESQDQDDAIKCQAHYSTWRNLRLLSFQKAPEDYTEPCYDPSSTTELLKLTHHEDEGQQTCKEPYAPSSLLDPLKDC